MALGSESSKRLYIIEETWIKAVHFEASVFIEIAQLQLGFDEKYI